MLINQTIKPTIKSIVWLVLKMYRPIEIANTFGSVLKFLNYKPTFYKVVKYSMNVAKLVSKSLEIKVSTLSRKTNHGIRFF